MKWQDINKKVMNMVASIGAFGVILMIVLLARVDVSYTNYPDCNNGTDCYARFEMNTSYWEVCFNIDDTVVTPQFFKKQSRSRTIWVNTSRYGFVTTYPDIQTELMFGTYKSRSITQAPDGKWLREVKTGDCIKRGKVNYLYVIGKKEANQEIKWSADLFEIDPIWLGKENGEDFILFRDNGDVGMPINPPPYLKEMSSTGVDKYLNKTSNYLGNNSWNITICHDDYDKYKDTCVKGDCLDTYPIKKETDLSASNNINLKDNMCDSIVYNANFNENQKAGLSTWVFVPLNPYGNMTAIKEYTYCNYRECFTDIKFMVSGGEAAFWLDELTTSYECSVDFSVISGFVTIEENVTYYNCTLNMTVEDELFNYTTCANGINYNMTCQDNALCFNESICYDYNWTTLDCINWTNYTRYDHDVPYLVLENVTRTHTNKEHIFIIVNDTKEFKLKTIMTNEDETCKFNISVKLSNPETREYQNTTILDPFIISGNSSFPSGFFNRTQLNPIGYVELNDLDDLQELPNNQVVDQEFDKINMTGNVLLMHMNNDSSIGENETFVNDSSGSGNNGTVTGAVFNSTGKLNGAFDFDGSNDFINITDNTNDLLDGFTVGFTICSWVKRDTTGQEGIVSKYITTGNQRSWRLYFDTNNNINFGIGQTGTSTTLNTFISSNAITDTNWNHICGKWESSIQVEAYLNGINMTGSTAGNARASVFNGTAPVWVGQYANNFIKGKIDELSVWNRSLSATEILDIYEEQKGTYTTKGEYESNITDTGASSQFKNISWVTEVPYQTEMPSNQEVETNVSIIRGINMTGNVLLVHLNNDSAFGENSTHVFDFSGNGNNGTIGNDAHVNLTNKKLGAGAYEFDGSSDYINVGNNSLFNTGGNITIVAWVYRKSLQLTPYIITKHGISGNEDIASWGLRLEDNAPYAGFYVQNGGTQFAEFTATPMSELNVWHHIAVTHDTINAVLYIDGEFSQTVSLPFVPQTEIGDVIIGYLGRISTTSLDGLIDEIGVWNRTLTATEINDIYKRGALRLNLSVRSCNDINCSGETYNDTSDVSPVNLSGITPDNQYFQYKYRFETDGNVTPQLYNVSIGYETIEIDVTPPSIAYQFPTEGQAFQQQNYNGTIRVTINEDGNCSINDANWTLESSTSQGFNFLNNTLIPTNTNYSINVSCNDTALNNASKLLSFILDDESPIWVDIPGNLTLEDSDSGFSVDFNATDNFFIGQYERNDTTNFDIIISNGILSNGTDLGIGTYHANVTVNDTANNLNATIFQVIIQDTTLPVSEFGVNPINNSNTSSQTLTFDLRCNDTNLDELSLYANWNGSWIKNQTNTSPNSEVFWNVSISGIPEGTWLWGIWCNDTNNNINTSLNKTFSVDITPPVSNSPSDESYNANTTATIEWILTDNFAPGTYTIKRNSTIQNNSLSWTNNTNLSVNINTTASGDWNYTISFNDSVANNGTEDIVIITIIGDVTAPSITYKFPTEGQSFQQQNYNGTIRVTINEDGNCTINDTRWGLESNTPQGFNFINNTLIPTNQNYSITSNCNDTAGNDANKTLSFFIDDASPIWVDIPGNITLEYLNGNVNVDFNTTDNFFVDIHFINDSTNFAINSSTGILTNATALVVGTYHVNVSVNDTLNNLNSTIWQAVIQDTTGPTVTFLYPPQQTLSNESVDFNVSLNEDGTGCFLSINGEPNVTMDNTSTTLWNYTNTSLVDGIYNATASCNDTQNNFGYATVLFAVDTVPPIISIFSPLTGNVSGITEVNFIFSISTQGADADQCDLYHNSTGTFELNSSVTNPANGTNSFKLNMSDGTYFYNWNCNDTNDARDWSAQDNQTFSVDTVAPIFDNYTNDTVEFHFDSISKQFTCSDTTLDQYFVNDTDNFAMDSNTGTLTNATKLSVRLYDALISCNDSQNRVSSVNYRVNVNDTLPPSFVSIPANATLEYLIDSLNVTFTAFDPSGIGLFSINWTTNFTILSDDVNGTIINSSFLVRGISIINVTVNDTFGQTNSTFYEVNVSDSIKPLINFTNPTTPSGTFSQNFIVSNVTASDPNDGIDTINTTLWNSTSLVRSNTSLTSPFFWNITELSDGTYFLNATVNDTSNNINNTETRTIILDTTPPKWSNNKTNLTASANIGDTVYFNVTLNDLSPDFYIFGFYNSTAWVNDSAVSYTDGEEVSVLKIMPVGSGIVNWTWFINDTFGQNNQTDVFSANLSLEKSINLSFGPNITVFRVETCGPDIINNTAIPQGQNSSIGIDYVCNNGDAGAGDIQIKISSNLNNNWTWWGSNTSILSNLINLTTSYQTIYEGLAQGSCTYFWHVFNCTNATQRPGAYEQYKII